MNIVSFMLVLAGVLLNAAAQLFLKAGTNSIGVLSFESREVLSTLFRIIFNPYIFSGLGCYVVSVAIWIIALSRVPVSVAYPMLSIGYVVNALAAWYLFGEAITVQKTLGISVIVVGVYFVATS
jgi:multidrug transporter EmrE-like cation transporter